MGLIEATGEAASGTLADTWREFFYCEALPADVLLKKAEKRTGKRSSNTKGNDNVISNGSIVAVADGQCMIIVDQGKVVELCAQPGEFVWDSSTEPSIFYGNLGVNILETFKKFGRRIAFGGDTGHDQRVYYINTKEIPGNKYGTAKPVPFRVVDNNIGLDVDISVRCHGEYSYKLTDPILFYTNVSGNVSDEYRRTTIDGQLKTELMTALQPAFAKISEMGIRYSALPGHTTELADALNEVLSSKWGELRGIEVVSFGVDTISALPEDEKMIKDLQKNAVFKNPTMAAATLTGAQAEAMKAAASNKTAGPMMAFAGMNMANQAGGVNAGDLYAMGQQQQQQVNAKQPTVQNSAAGGGADDGWTCSCGKSGNKGKFCSNCGQPKPVTSGVVWTCTCGTDNTGKFCENCGKPRPKGSSFKWKCDKCGWEPSDLNNIPRFCPECGDPFNDSDKEDV
ncbi:MAG: SPFH domain-containing protein [Lachnospiraceae bacterium]|nr:SPFH domain-containing protein [Lachnospiraceae bacterium]